MTYIDRKPSISERIAEQVAKFPDVFATPILNILDYERPKLIEYYLEIDRRIQEFLQNELDKAGYSHVMIQSQGQGMGGSPAYYPYVYQLVPRDKDPKWAERFLPNVHSALRKRLDANTELDCRLELGFIFVKLRQKNRMYVEKARKENK